MTAARPSCDSPQQAIDAIAPLINPTHPETVPLERALGRALAAPLIADRPSPACDVSAMDGYALRRADLARATSLPVAGEILIGREPPALPQRAALRIVTGAPVPPEADAVIKREDVAEHPDRIDIDPAVAQRLTHAANIRRRGENIAQGETVLHAGRAITPATTAALAMFGAASVHVHRRPRVSILVTGDEVLPPDSSPTPWQLRDSNGPALSALLGARPWLDVAPPRRAPDDFNALRTILDEALNHTDALVVSGGVSMGDRDHVPAALESLGARIIFHRVAQRPGKPMLAAITRNEQPILALPGNPLSVLVTARRIAIPVLRRLAGFTNPDPAPAAVELEASDHRRLDLWWHRLVRLTAPGRAALIASMGSGDIPSAAASDGFIELPPNADAPGPWPFYAWCAEQH